MDCFATGCNECCVIGKNGGKEQQTDSNNYMKKIAVYGFLLFEKKYVIKKKGSLFLTKISSFYLSILKPAM